MPDRDIKQIKTNRGHMGRTDAHNYSNGFYTHSKYLSAFLQIALGDTQHTEKALGALADRTLSATKAATALKPFSPAVKSNLHRAWATEVQLATTLLIGPETELLDISAAWATIQSYYIMHASFQALELVGRSESLSTHQASMKRFASYWGDGKLTLEPWTLSFGSSLREGSNLEGVKGSKVEGISPYSTHVWSNDLTELEALNVACKALKTTRSELLKVVLTQKRQEKYRTLNKDPISGEARRQGSDNSSRNGQKTSGKRNLSESEKAQIEANFRPVTLMDYLYRLRLKANYNEVRMFLDGGTSDSLREYIRNLRMLSAANLLVHEVQIGRRVGFELVANEMDVWANRNSLVADENLIATRVKIYRSWQ